MALTLLLGGARSGKSSLAGRMAGEMGEEVVVVVTGSARDEEMAERIRRHRAERPPTWRTIEEPEDLVRALSTAPPDPPMIVDCLTLWIANGMEAGWHDAELEERSRRAAEIASARPGPTFAVSNEVGWGIVPVNVLARRFRDVLGRTNQLWAEAAERTLLMVAGRVLPLVSPTEYLDSLD
ncbi:MAG: bifunctional adenosylcobinamide kinase/adenosylcobinamide-phosphate guanylyltransferase [Actinomycetota bacterium]